MSDIPCADAAAFITALSNAVAGDTITLTAGVTYDTAAGFTLRNHGGATPIVIRSSALSALRTRQRVSPGLVTLMPIVRSTATNTPVFSAAASAGPWTLVGLAITSSANQQQQGLIELPAVGTTITTEADQPHDIVIDRCYIYGNPTPTTGNIRGIHADAVNFTLRDSWVSDFKYSGSDSQAIFVQQGRQHLIENNYLEGAAENLLYGGSQSSIEAHVSSDITIRYNRLAKPASWNRYHPTFGSTTGSALTSAGPNSVSCTGTAGTSTSHGLSVYHSVRINSTGEHRRVTAVGGADTFTLASAFTADPSSAAWTKLVGWDAKNLLELKQAERVLVEGNLLEGSWPSGQDGRAVLFTVRNSSSGTGRNPWARTRDVIFRHNWVKNVTSVFNITGEDIDNDGDRSNRTVKTAGAGTVSTVGTAATFSGAHGLSIGDIVRIGGVGAQAGHSREVTATPLTTTATLRSAFAANQITQAWDKWSTKVNNTNFLIEHNVLEHVGKGELNAYYDADVGLGYVLGLITLSPSNITIRHNTVVYSDEAAGAGVYIGSTGDVVTNFTVQDNIVNFGGASGFFVGESAFGSTAISTFTTGTVVTRDNVIYGTNSDATGNPANNSWPTDVADVGFASLTDRRLNLTSGTYRAGQANDASDSTDMGANIAMVTGRVFRRHGLGQGW